MALPVASATQVSKTVPSASKYGGSGFFVFIPVLPEFGPLAVEAVYAGRSRRASLVRIGLAFGFVAGAAGAPGLGLFALRVIVRDGLAEVGFDFFVSRLRLSDSEDSRP